MSQYQTYGSLLMGLNCTPSLNMFIVSEEDNTLARIPFSERVKVLPGWRGHPGCQWWTLPLLYYEYPDRHAPEFITPFPVIVRSQKEVAPVSRQPCEVQVPLRLPNNIITHTRATNR